MLLRDKEGKEVARIDISQGATISEVRELVATKYPEAETANADGNELGIILPGGFVTVQGIVFEVIRELSRKRFILKPKNRGMAADVISIFQGEPGLVIANHIYRILSVKDNGKVMLLLNKRHIIGGKAKIGKER